MHRIIVLSGNKYIPIMNSSYGFKRFTKYSHLDSICITKNKYGYISYTIFHYSKNLNIITDIRKQLTDKEIDKLLILMNIMGTKAAFNTLF